jgi:hypothetical protein
MAPRREMPTVQIVLEKSREFIVTAVTVSEA